MSFMRDAIEEAIYMIDLEGLRAKRNALEISACPQKASTVIKS